MRSLDRLINNSALLIDNPSVIIKIIRNYFLKFTMSKRPLRTVDICFDYNCNNNCQHCYAADFKDSTRNVLEISEIKRVIDICSKEGAIHFNIIGGEPTLNKDLLDIIDYIHSKSALVSLATNGSMLTLGYTHILKKHKLDVVLISLDSLDADKQNEFRGDLFFQKAMSGIENSLRAGLRVFISAVLTKVELKGDGFKKLLNFCQNKGILLHVNLPALFGRWKDRDDLFFDDKDIADILVLYRNKYVRTCEMSSYFQTACRTGIEKLHITAYGDVMPCTFIPISFGNVMEENVSLIRARIYSFPFIKACNELCIPSTNKLYHEFFKENIASAKKLPVKFSEL